MGVRTGAYTGASETKHYRSQENRRMYSTVDGTAARKINPQQRDNIRLDRRRNKGVTASQLKALRNQKHLFIVLGAVAAIVLLFLAGELLLATNTGSSISSSIDNNEELLEELSVSNDAKEYEIENSYDLNQIIDTATNELGMVRSSASQVVMYNDNNSEYLLQVAAVPKE